MLRVVAATVQPLGLLVLEAGMSLLLVVARGAGVVLGLQLACLLVLDIVRKMAIVHFTKSIILNELL